MSMNIEYIHLKYKLLKAFMIDAYENILDVSYTVDKGEIIIQIVLLKGSGFPIELDGKLNNVLEGKRYSLIEIYISKENFNETKGDWNPTHYNWLENVLFSKAELL
jgi:hypothetical protein